MRLLFSLFFLVLSSAAFAAPPVYNIDPGHTRVTFRISHLGYINMPGHFNNVTGQIYFDKNSVENSSVDVTIKADSVSMDHAVLDKKLQGKEFFNIAKYPTITFKSTEVEKTGLDKGNVTGNLTMLGVTKPVTLKVKFNKGGWNKYDGSEAVGFSAWGKLRRSDFGMTAYLPDVGDDIRFDIEVEAHQKTAQQSKTQTPDQQQGTQMPGASTGADTNSENLR